MTGVQPFFCMRIHHKSSLLSGALLTLLVLMSALEADAQTQTPWALCADRYFKSHLGDLERRTGRQVDWLTRSQINQEGMDYCRKCLRSGTLESCMPTRSKPREPEVPVNNDNSLTTRCYRKLLSGDTSMRTDVSPAQQVRYVHNGADIFLGMDLILTYYKLTKESFKGSVLYQAVRQARDGTLKTDSIFFIYPSFVGAGGAMCATLAQRCTMDRQASGCKEFFLLIDGKVEEPGFCKASFTQGATQPEPPPPLPRGAIQDKRVETHRFRFKPVCQDRSKQPDLDQLQSDKNPTIRLYPNNPGTKLGGFFGGNFAPGIDFKTRRDGDYFEGAVSFPQPDPVVRKRILHGCEGAFTLLRLICAEDFEERVKIIFNSCNTCEVFEKGAELRCLEGYHEEEEEDKDLNGIIGEERDRIKDAEGAADKAREGARQAVLTLCLAENYKFSSDPKQAHDQFVKAYQDCNRFIGDARAACNLPAILNGEDRDVCKGIDDLFNVPAGNQGFSVKAQLGGDTKINKTDYMISYADGTWTDSNLNRVGDIVDLGEFEVPCD